MADISDREITAVPDSDAEEPTLHPVLDVPVVEHEISRSRGIDWVVFGVTSIAALAFVIWLTANGQSHFAAGSIIDTILLIGCGPVTAIPLICYAMAAKQLRLSTIGILRRTRS